jgi:hypothetical protein
MRLRAGKGKPLPASTEVVGILAETHLQSRCQKVVGDQQNALVI